MSGFVCRSICVLALLLALPALSRAQENLDARKTPAQLFASDCAVCHKSPQGLAAKAGGFSGLEGFLREHYTTSRESAAAVAGYLRAVGSGPAAPARNAKRPPKGDDKAKAGDKTGEKSGDKKPDSAKSTGPKPADAKASEQKPSEPKPAEPKPDVKPAEPKAEPTAAEPKPAEGGKSE